MRELIFVTLSLTRGGAERVISSMCNEYFSKRYKVTVISLMAAEAEYALSGKIRFLTVDRRPEQMRENMAKRFIRRRGRLKKMLRDIGQSGGDVAALVSFLPEPNMIACSLAHELPYPVIISVRNDPAREYASRARHALMKYLYPKAAGYVFQTGRARDYFSFSREIINRSAVIPNPVADEFLGAEPPACRKKEIVSVGRLEKQKNPLLLLHAFSDIRKEYPGYRLNFYGEGSMRAELEKEIAALGLTEAVRLKGNVPGVGEAIRDAALYVLSSDYEGMPNALMEAMALGLPCISTDCPCGGPAFLIRPGENGILTEPENEEALADAMRYMLAHPKEARRMGRQAQKITETLSKERIYGMWDDFIKEMSADFRTAGRSKKREKDNGECAE